MVIFFYGQDSYRLSIQEKKLKEKFISASLGDTNLATLEAKNLTYDEYIRQILAMPFLSKTRLVIIDNILSEGKKELQEQIGEALTPKGSPSGNKVPSSTVLLFTETKPDKRLSLFKKLIKVDKVQEFPVLEDIQIKRWIKAETEARGGQIDSVATNLLFENIGPDLWRLSNEIDKLIAYSKQLTAENIELLVQSQEDKDIFRLVDALGQKNFKNALKETTRLQQTGGNEIYIFTMIVYQYRNLLIVKDLQDRKINNSFAIAKASGLNPYVVQKTLAQTSSFSMDGLKKAYAMLLDFDGRLKTGKIEGKAAIALLLAKLCK